MTAPDVWKWLALALCTSLLQCSGGTPTEVFPDVSSTPACHPVQKKPDGTCCPVGQFFSNETHTCERVGPPECAAVVFNAPEECVPRWCWDWQDEAEKACEAWKQGCETEGRACTDAEITEGKGCPAGTFPESDKLGDCAPAGYFPGSGVPRDWNGDLKTLPPVPPLEDSIPPGVPPLTPLPAVDDMFFCRDGQNAEAHFCTAAEMQVCHRGPAGEMPAAEKCVYVGVPWPSVCPPGFVVDEATKVEDGKLAPCKPDPADCGEDDYGDAGLQNGMGIVFVNSATGADGNAGTRQAPLKTIGKGLAKIGGKLATVAVAAGAYSESLVISKPLTLRGRCAAMVTVVGSAGSWVLTVNGTAQQQTLLIRGLRFGGKGQGVDVAGGPKVRLERVMVAGVSMFGIGIHGSGAVLEGDGVLVVGTLPLAGNKQFGRGMVVQDGAQVTLQDTRLSANRDVGLQVAGVGTTLGATRFLVDGTLSQESDKQFGSGLNIVDGAQVVLEDARLSSNRDVGLLVDGPGTAVDATRLLVDGTLPRQSDKGNGLGMAAGGGAQVTLHDTRLSANREMGLHVSGAGTTLGAIRLLVDGTLSNKSKAFGEGVNVQEGAHVTMQEARLSENRAVGLFVDGAGSTLGATRLLVDATLPQESDNQAGWGASVQHGAEVTLQDARLSANRGMGLFVGGADTRLDATRLLVDGPQPQESDTQAGRGVGVELGAEVTLQDVRLSANRDVGLFVDGAGTTVGATRLVVDGTRPRDDDKEGGRGLSVQKGAQVTLRHTRLSANRDAGLYTSGVGTILGTTRLLVDATLPQESDSRFGRGVSVLAGADLQMVAARLVGNRDAGLFAGTASMHVIGVTIDATAPQDSDQTGGAGIWLIAESTASLVATALKSNHGAGLATSQASVDAQGVVVLATGWGEYLEIDINGNVNGKTTTFADGILLRASPSSTVDRCLFAGNQRAGILTDSSPGTKVTRTLVNAGNGLYGFVLQHTLDAFDEFNTIFGATLQNRAVNAGLSLPKPPEPAATLPPTEGISP